MDSFIGQETVNLGIILERRPSSHPWQDETWHAVGVVPQAAPQDPRETWPEILEEGEVRRYRAGTLTLSLFRRETDGYVSNLEQAPPRVWVVLRADMDPEAKRPCYPFHVTACPFEAQIYLDNGEDIVETVPMPEPVAAWLGDFVKRNHVAEPFKKRKRGPKTPAGERRGPFEPPLGSPPRREEK